MGLVAQRMNLISELKGFATAGKPTWGTCAGLILLADGAVGEPDLTQRCTRVIMLKQHSSSQLLCLVHSLIAEQAACGQSAADCSATAEPVLAISQAEPSMRLTSWWSISGLPSLCAHRQTCLLSSAHAHLAQDRRQADKRS